MTLKTSYRSKNLWNGRPIHASSGDVTLDFFLRYVFEKKKKIEKTKRKKERKKESEKGKKGKKEGKKERQN